MVAFYVRRIEAGKMALDEVPVRWREQVETELRKESEVNEENGR